MVEVHPIIKWAVGLPDSCMESDKQLVGSINRAADCH
jgi:hypothetical protein